VSAVTEKKLNLLIGTLFPKDACQWQWLDSVWKEPVVGSDLICLKICPWRQCLKLVISSDLIHLRDTYQWYHMWMTIIDDVWKALSSRNNLTVSESLRSVEMTWQFSKDACQWQWLYSVWKTRASGNDTIWKTRVTDSCLTSEKNLSMSVTWKCSKDNCQWQEL
jgi:hypothetical protein